MKKLFVCLMIACMLLSGCALAEDLGIQIIPNEITIENNGELSLDDLQLGPIYSLGNDALMIPQEFLTVDFFAQFGENGDYSVSDNYRSNGPMVVYSETDSECSVYSKRYNDAFWCESGDNASFLWFRVDMTNTNSEIENLTDLITVQAVYRDEFKFGGWIRQVDYTKFSANTSNGGVTRMGFENSLYPMQVVMNPSKVEPAGFMTTSTYILGCTLPNYVIEDKESPLRLEFTVGEHEMTYHIRK